MQKTFFSNKRHKGLLAGHSHSERVNAGGYGTRADSGYREPHGRLVRRGANGFARSRHRTCFCLHMEDCIFLFAPCCRNGKEPSSAVRPYRVCNCATCNPLGVWIPRVSILPGTKSAPAITCANARNPVSVVDEGGRARLSVPGVRTTFSVRPLANLSRTGSVMRAEARQSVSTTERSCRSRRIRMAASIRRSRCVTCVGNRRDRRGTRHRVATNAPLSCSQLSKHPCHDTFGDVLLRGTLVGQKLACGPNGRAAGALLRNLTKMHSLIYMANVPRSADEESRLAIRRRYGAEVGSFPPSECGTHVSVRGCYSLGRDIFTSDEPRSDVSAKRDWNDGRRGEGVRGRKSNSMRNESGCRRRSQS